jgi:hypothetical protein
LPEDLLDVLINLATVLDNGHGSDLPVVRLA